MMSGNDEKLQQQEQQLIEQNMKIEELQKALKVYLTCHFTSSDILFMCIA